MPDSAGFPPEVRVRKRREYLAVRAARRSVRDDVLELAWRRTGAGPARLGLVVPIRGLGAVGRNRIKRVVKEIFRARRGALPAGYDFVVAPRDRARAADFAAASASFDALTARFLARERP
ncbi:MAG TPA: ribonuclease P protein component [Planctomycetota bacterium]|nr:ribonuclease P protein component [Planctomycetota bacterium]